VGSPGLENVFDVVGSTEYGLTFRQLIH